MSQIEVEPGTLLDRIAFQGTADDARTLLISVTSTVVTVIALVLGLTVVALQLSSTAFSPRLLRNFLRDRATQVVLSVFIATFVYSAAGLFTVGLSAGSPDRGVPPAGHQRVDPAAVRQPRHGGVLRRPPDALDPDRRDQQAGGRQHPAGARASCTSETVGGLAPRAPEWAVPLLAPQVRIRADRAPRAAAAGGQPGRGDHLPATPGGPARRRRHHDRLGLGSDRRGPATGRPSRSSRRWTPTSGSGSSAPWSRMWRSASGSSSTSPARRCRRRSTTPTPRSRPSTTCR